MLEGTTKAERTAIAERRKAAYTNWEFSLISKVNIFRRSLEVNLKPWAFWMTKHAAAPVLKLTSSKGQKAVWKERSGLAMSRLNLLRACWLKRRMNMTAKVMIFYVQLISQSLIGHVPKSRWGFLKPRKWSTMPCALPIWTSTAAKTCLIGSGTSISLGCTCTGPRSTVRRSTLITLEGILTTIF